MDTRHIRRIFITAAATLGTAVAIAGAGPMLIVERVATPELGERLTVGLEARALCVRLVADSVGNTVRLVRLRGCATAACRRLSA